MINAKSIGYFSGALVCCLAQLGCQPPEQIEAGTGTVSGAAPVVSVRNGQAIATWHRPTGVKVSSYHAATGWSAPQIIGSGTFPDIAVSNGDAAVALFGSGSALQAAEHTSTGWLPAQILDTGPSFGYSVAIEGGGRASAVWTVGSQVKASIQEGAGWYGTTVLSSSASFGRPQIATNDSGVVFAAWCGPSNRIYSARRVWPGSWEATVSSATACCQSPALDTPAAGVSVGVSSGGMAVIVGSTGSRVCERRYVPSFGWQTTGVLGSPGSDAVTPQVAVSPDGHAIVAWHNLLGGGGGLIKVRAYDPVSGWAAVLTGPAAGDGRLGVGIGSNNTGAVVYRGGGGISAVAFSDGALTSPIVVATAPDTLYYLRVGFDPSQPAQGVSVWQRTGVGSENIWGSRLGL